MSVAGQGNDVISIITEKPSVIDNCDENNN